METVTVALTQGKFAIVDVADAELVGQYKWHACIRKNWEYAASSSTRANGGKSIYLHRLLMSPPEGMHVDHINGNGLDCRRANLRVCTNAENRRNSRPTKSAVKRHSKHKGVSFDPRQPGRPWVAYININDKRKGLGAYEHEAEAARAYNAAALVFHGSFAQLNKIEGLTFEESIAAPVRNRRIGRVPRQRAG